LEVDVMVKLSYSDAFREQALKKVYQRGDRPVRVVAEELNVNYHTLKNWLKMEGKRGKPQAVEERSPRVWSAEERLRALLESHGLEGEALNAWCRQRGVYAHHLVQWREEFCGLGESSANNKVLRQLKDENHKLQRELARKEKALAEAGALLVLKKKYQALWEAEDA
jgi:transposase-like protein